MERNLLVERLYSNGSVLIDTHTKQKLACQCPWTHTSYRKCAHKQQTTKSTDPYRDAICHASMFTSKRTECWMQQLRLFFFLFLHPLSFCRAWTSGESGIARMKASKINRRLTTQPRGEIVLLASRFLPTLLFPTCWFLANDVSWTLCHVPKVGRATTTGNFSNKI